MITCKNLVGYKPSDAADTSTNAHQQARARAQDQPISRTDTGGVWYPCPLSQDCFHSLCFAPFHHPTLFPCVSQSFQSHVKFRKRPLSVKSRSFLFEPLSLFGVVWNRERELWEGIDTCMFVLWLEGKEGGIFSTMSQQWRVFLERSQASPKNGLIK